MALVTYSDSEASDAEPETTTAPAEKSKKPDASSSTNFHIDRSHPRKIRVALPELKPEPSADSDADDGPARKKARLGGGGTFSGFNALLPAPKRAAEKPVPAASTRKVFSLKTGATPGFDRDADAEMKRDQALDSTVGDADGDADGNAGPTSTSAGTTADEQDAPVEKKSDTGPIKLQGNPMMFRPLSVGRPAQKKKKTAKTTPPQPTLTASTTQPSAASSTSPATKIAPQPAPPAPRPKVSLFSLSSETTAGADTTPAPSTTYEPLVYNTGGEKPSENPAPAPESTFSMTTEYSSAATAPSSNPTASLDSIADDLNLSRSERRQLFGRHAPPAQSRVLSFNTDEAYASNQALAQTELAAAQHNPVRAIAPGKHTLQQLVNAASSQREALEESFASGKRNKKEAGSKYGW